MSKLILLLLTYPQNVFMESTPQPPVTLATPAPRRTSFGLGSVSFLVGILLFILPFVNIKCGDVTVKELKGYELATGFSIDEKKTKSPFENLDSNQPATSKTDKKEPNTYALVALGLGVIGFVVSLLARGRSPLAAFIGILTAAALIGLMIDVKKKLKLEMPTDTPSNDSFNMNLDNVKITAEFTPWFYIAVVAFIVAAFFSWQLGKAKT